VVGGGVAAVACCKALEDMDYAITVFDDEGGKVSAKPGEGFRVYKGLGFRMRAARYQPSPVRVLGFTRV
jgi:uncharacterized protein with NAD-binding domain and iron-sulfur cluster